MNELGIVIVNYNGALYIEKTIKALKRTVPEAHLFIVDSLSTDNSRDVIEKEAAPNVSILHYLNKGYASAANMGVRDFWARGFKWIVIMNGDVFTTPGWFETMRTVMEKDPSIFISGPKQVDMAGKIVAAGVVGDGRSASIRGFGQLDKPDLYNKVEECCMVCGSFMLVRTPLLNKVGIMDERFFMYYEETDWQYRARSMGFKCVYIPVTPPFIHILNGSCSDRSVLVKHMSKSREIFKSIWGYVPNG